MKVYRVILKVQLVGIIPRPLFLRLVEEVVVKTDKI